jgi:uncharacterized protein DUF955
MSKTNHKVRFRSEEEIADIAARCWAISRRQRPFTFDVVGFLTEVLLLEGIDYVVPTRGRKKGRLAIKFFDREFTQDDPAYVEFAKNQRDNYVTLNADKCIWRKAKRGDSDACEILAHEIGHILLHDHYANAFSSDVTQQKLFAGTSKEDFAEWQAITFASHLMVPTYVAQRFPRIDILTAATNAPERLVAARLETVKNTKKILSAIYEEDVCSRCGNLTLLRSGHLITCATCGGVIPA